MSKKQNINSFIKSKGGLSKNVTIKVTDDTKMRIDLVNEFLNKKNLKIDMQDYMKNEIETFLNDVEAHLKNEYPNEFTTV